MPEFMPHHIRNAIKFREFVKATLPGFFLPARVTKKTIPHVYSGFCIHGKIAYPSTALPAVVG
jgi:hypothetical protein